MPQSIGALCNGLPSSSITVTALQKLDFIVPGQWENHTSFAHIVASVTGEDLSALNASVGQRAELIFASSNRFRNAVTLFSAVDTLDQVAAGAAVVSKVTDFFGGLDLLERFTPKPETTQALDAGLKLITELLAFGFLKGWPSASFDSVADWVIDLQRYAKTDLMRICAFIVIDGLLPLGPDFMSKIVETISNLASSKLAQHSIFDVVSKHLPGDSASEKQSFIVEALSAVSAFINGFVADKGLTQELVKSKLGDLLNVAEGGMDYVAAALDASTSYFTHTGTQTVARVCAEIALNEIKDELWRAHVDSFR